MRCCRYMKFEHAAESLRSGRYKVSYPFEFNDPFECRGNYINYEEPVRKYVHENYERLRFEAIRNTSSTTIEQQSRFTENYLFDLYCQLMFENVNDSWLESIGHLMFVMCFVKECQLSAASDVLFWSHYADAGRGVRITFDMPKPDDKSPYYVRDVRYEDKIPMFDCSQMRDLFRGKELADYLDLLSYTKGKAWAYENEVRMFIPRYLAEKDWNGIRYLSKDEKTSVNLLRLGNCYTRRADFGPRVDYGQAMCLMDELRQKKDASHINFYQAVMKPGEYAYTYEKMV